MTYSNTTLVKVKLPSKDSTNFIAKIQIQHLLKLNRVKLDDPDAVGRFKYNTC